MSVTGVATECDFGDFQHGQIVSKLRALVLRRRVRTTEQSAENAGRYFTKPFVNRAARADERIELAFELLAQPGAALLRCGVLLRHGHDLLLQFDQLLVLPQILGFDL
jgi:hypothetical protein